MNAIFPAIKKAVKAPIFEAKLKILEVADDSSKGIRIRKCSVRIKILPVPGPKNPS
jgi:hypothetical protein